MPNMMRMITEELVGGYRGLADAVHFDFLPAARMVIACPEVLERTFLLGQNVANAVLKKNETSKKADYLGMPGFCPYCYNNLLLVDPDGSIYCPQCNIQATPEVVDGKLKISFAQENLDKSRWSPYGQDLHGKNIQKGHKRAAEGAEEIKAKFPDYSKFLKETRISLTEIK